MKFVFMKEKVSFCVNALWVEICIHEIPVAQRQEMVLGTRALLNGSSYVSRAAALEGTGEDKVL